MELIILQMDLGRQKENLAYMKSYVDFAKASGYNAILYYMESAVRTEDTAFLNPEDTYSLEEMAEIVQYTEAQGLTAIPAFENLGHMDTFFSYPEFQHLSECADGPIGRFGEALPHFCGCTSHEGFYPFIDKYVTDILSVFPSKYVHMGMDEIFDFAICPRCKKRMEEEKLTRDDLFYEHLMHSRELLAKHGKTMMIWDDYFEMMDIVHRLPRDIIFTNWNYHYITEEPRGHWVERVKRDWFAYYEELGFRYIFCTMAHPCSSAFNTDSFTEYAKRYHPMGAMMTCWCHAADFYFGGYPQTALAGRQWSNPAPVSEEERVAIYAKLVGSEECAKLLLSLHLPLFFGGAWRNNIACKSQENSFLPNLLRFQTAYALEKLMEFHESAEGLAKDIIADACAYVCTCYTSASLAEIGTKIFNHYLAEDEDLSLPFAALDALVEKFERCMEMERGVWKRNRADIRSKGGAFERKCGGLRKLTKTIKESAKQNMRGGVLITDLMLHEGFGWQKCAIRVKYEGESEPTLVYEGDVKLHTSCLEVGGGYTLFIALEDKPVEYVLFSGYGAGALYVSHMRTVLHKKKRVAATVTPIEGLVRDEQNILYDEARFASLGSNDGVAHFNSIAMGKEHHTVKVTFMDHLDYRIK